MSVNCEEARVTLTPVHRPCLVQIYPEHGDGPERQLWGIPCGRQSPVQLTPTTGGCLSVCLQAGGRRWGEEKPWKCRVVTSHWRSGSTSRLDKHTHVMISIITCARMASSLPGRPYHRSADEDVGNSALTLTAGGTHFGKQPGRFSNGVFREACLCVPSSISYTGKSRYCPLVHELTVDVGYWSTMKRSVEP